MKHLLSLSLVAVVSTLITGCATQRQLQVAERVSNDTLYINNVQYDSIYIDRWQKVYQQSDTVYLERTKYEYKYKLLRDTIYKSHIDTIPVIREVEVIREVRHIPLWAKVLSSIGALALILLLIRFISYMIIK